uniref:DUF1376 domain-containing protein n=1 Tax=Rhabditophanes sp. KR3021 TaxID=114890 RepID=A0AC35TJF9_9BILA
MLKNASLEEVGPTKIYKVESSLPLTKSNALPPQEPLPVEDYVYNRGCQQLRDDEQDFNQKFEAESVLDIIWPERHNLSTVNKVYIYFFLDPNVGGKVLAKDNVFDDFLLAVCHIGESEKNDRIEKYYSKYSRKVRNEDLFDRTQDRINQINKAGLERMVVKLPVASKEMAENLEYIWMEKPKWQITNCHHNLLLK